MSSTTSYAGLTVFDPEGADVNLNGKQFVSGVAGQEATSNMQKIDALLKDKASFIVKTSTQWARDTTVLRVNDFGVASDTSVIKRGNGTDVWTNLNEFDPTYENFVEAGYSGSQSDFYTLLLSIPNSEKSSNKVTSLSAESTDKQYPSAKCVYNAIRNAVGSIHYTVRWDKVNAQMVRMNSAEGITTDTANFRHNGSKNLDINNPFDVIYPWSEITLCNINIDTYYALSPGADIKSCVTAWLGDPDFSYTHTDGVWRYRPEFWYKVWDDGTYRYFDVSPWALPGYIHAVEAIEGRWHGGVYTRTVNGTNKSCLIPRAGMPGKNIAMSTLHTYAKNYGASVEDIYLYDANDVLMLVEYAAMNTQNAIGNGVCSLYRQSSDLIQADATSSATVKVLKSAADACIVGAIFDIGTANGGTQVGSFVISAVNDDPDDATLEIITLTTDGITEANVTVTTANFWSIHGMSNTVDSDIGAASGYIGANSRSIAYYRGQEAFGNMWRYVLGAYRQTGTGHIWIANSRAEADAYDALDVSIHKDTGLALPQGDGGAATSGCARTLHLCGDVPAAPFCGSVGGSSANPVGDYVYIPALTTGNTILLVGADANSWASVGRFYGYWAFTAASNWWYIAAVPVLKSP